MYSPSSGSVRILDPDKDPSSGSSPVWPAGVLGVGGAAGTGAALGATGAPSIRTSRVVLAGSAAKKTETIFLFYGNSERSGESKFTW